MRPLLACAFVTIAAGAIAGWGAQNQPTFRGTVNLVEVDVAVTDGDGQPVRGLTRDDFEILEDGRPQTISTFSAVDIPLAPRSAATIAPLPDVEPDVTTNADPERRVYVILMDAPSTAAPAAAAMVGYSYTLRAKQVAQQFVRTALQSGDQVAVVHARGTFADSQGFTTRRRLIDASIERYGRGLSGNDLGIRGGREIAFNLDTYRAIEDLSTRLGTIRARRKGIVWIGGQINAFPESDAGFNAAQVATLKVAYRDAMRTAARNNVAVYSVDPTGLTSELGTDEMLRMASLRAVAEDTGGLAVVNTSNFDAGFAAIINDMSAYYLLGYTPAEEARDGAFRPIQVRVKRPGVTVRARTGYYAGGAPGTRPTPSPSRAISEAAAAALARPIATRGLTVGVVATAFKAADAAQPVVIGAHVDAEGVALVPNASLSVSYQLRDVEGRVASGHYKIYRLDLRPQTRERALNAGLRFVHRAALRPGRYELRLVVEQPGGALGSVVSHVEVPNLNERLDASEIILGRRATGNDVMLDLTKDDELTDVLKGDPVILRRFTRADTLLAFVESYTEVAFNVVNVTGSIVDRNGQTVARANAQGVDAYTTRERTTRGHLAAFDLSRVEPGEHVLTMTARASSNQTVARHVRITIDR